MSESSVVALNDKRPPVDLSVYMRPQVSAGDPRSWGSYALPAAISEADRASAARESAERPVGFYVGAAAESRFADPAQQAADGRMALRAVQNSFEV